MNRTKYDVIVAGGSLSGLLTAREIGSKSSISVKVLEADHEIGTPEHCGGLVSLSGLRNLGIVPSSRTFRNHITRAKISSRYSSFEVDAKLQDVVAIDRRELDKQIAFHAQKLGVEITTMNSMRSVSACSKLVVQQSQKVEDDIRLCGEHHGGDCILQVFCGCQGVVVINEKTKNWDTTIRTVRSACSMDRS